jgi:hypothetical protein
MSEAQKHALELKRERIMTPSLRSQGESAGWALKASATNAIPNGIASELDTCSARPTALESFASTPLGGSPFRRERKGLLDP